MAAAMLAVPGAATVTTATIRVRAAADIPRRREVPVHPAAGRRLRARVRRRVALPPMRPRLRARKPAPGTRWMPAATVAPLMPMTRAAPAATPAGAAKAMATPAGMAKRAAVATTPTRMPARTRRPAPAGRAETTARPAARRRHPPAVARSTTTRAMPEAAGRPAVAIPGTTRMSAMPGNSPTARAAGATATRASRTATRRTRARRAKARRAMATARRGDAVHDPAGHRTIGASRARTGSCGTRSAPRGFPRDISVTAGLRTCGSRPSLARYALRDLSYGALVGYQRA